MKTHHMPQKRVLTEEDTAVFTLLDEARKQYERFVDINQTASFAELADYITPSSSDYTVQKPLGYCTTK